MKKIAKFPLKGEKYKKLEEYLKKRRGANSEKTKAILKRNEGKIKSKTFSKIIKNLFSF